MRDRYGCPAWVLNPWLLRKIITDESVAAQVLAGRIMGLPYGRLP